MSFLLVAFLICSISYVALNKRIEDGNKIGYYVACVIIALLGVVM